MTLILQKERYQPTADDRLWLARAVEAEGEPRELVARALVNLFAYARTRKAYKGSLAALVRTYAQPINPEWYETGGKFLSSLKSKSSDEVKAAIATAKRRQSVHSARVVFSDDTRAAVAAALSTPWSSDVTDYAAPFVDARARGYLARSEPRQHENRLWTRAPGWGGYSVDGGVQGVLLLALIGVGVWLATR